MTRITDITEPTRVDYHLEYLEARATIQRLRKAMRDAVRELQRCERTPEGSRWTADEVKRIQMRARRAILRLEDASKRGV